MKKLLITGLSICLSLLLSVNVAKAEDDSPFITFDGNASQYFEFNTNQNELTDKFMGMMPGEERSETFTLVNNDQREMKFYLNTQVLKDLGEDSKTKGAVYEISFTRDGEEFYRGTIGGEDGSLVDLSGQSMGENMLMASLKENEKSVIKMSIGIDGDSMTNSYQNAAGELQFEFSVEYDDPEVVQPTIVEKIVKLPGKQINRYINAVKTGDYTELLPLVVGLAISAGLILVLVKTRKKKDTKEGE